MHTVIELTPDNDYTTREREFYNNNAKEMAQGDHRHHDKNPDYQTFFISPFEKDTTDRDHLIGLDFACGTGRNVHNLLETGAFDRVDGVDIAEKIIEEADRLLTEKGHTRGKDFELFVNNGIDAEVLPKEFYDHAMSTIALQHIPVYDIRFFILKSIFYSLKKGGTFTFQIGYGKGYGKSAYHDNCYEAQGFNTQHDVEVLDYKDVENDLKRIGFKKIKSTVRDSFSDGHPKWLFVTCEK